MGNSLNDLDFDIDNLLNDTLREESNSPPDKSPKKEKKKKGKKRYFFAFLICIFILFTIVNIKNKTNKEDIITGLSALKNYESSIEDLNGVGEDSYISQEIEYANSDKTKISFYKMVFDTVKYESLPVKITEKTLNGSKTIYEKSQVGKGEPVLMSIIDYSRIPIEKDKIKNIMDRYKLRYSTVDYSNLLVDVFCEYMLSLEGKDIPVKTIKRVPYLNKDSNGNLSVSENEDIYLDKLLLSSKDFYDLLDRFSVVASSIGNVTKEWEDWNSKSEEEKKKLEEPKKELDEIKVSEEWLKWNSLPNEDKLLSAEPSKYNIKMLMSKDWCGSYYLQNEYYVLDKNGNKVKKAVSAEIGDGSKENPAGLNTDVVTCIVREKDVDGKKEVIKLPINVRMIGFGVSEEAIKWFEKQDTRNRGIDVTSELQYCYYEFEVTNLSSEDLVIYDNSCLSDGNANVSSRTGDMFGMTYEVKLKPDETGVIKTWGRSTELNKRYVIWGKDFARREEPVWFRVLAGDLEDSSLDKGVNINNSRHE